MVKSDMGLAFVFSRKRCDDSIAGRNDEKSVCDYLLNSAARQFVTLSRGVNIFLLVEKPLRDIPCWK